MPSLLGLSRRQRAERPPDASAVHVQPIVQPNYLAAAKDRQVTVAGLRLLRRLLATPELRPFLTHETLPGPDVRSDDELLAFAYANGSTTFHLCGTARITRSG